ncbi:MAG: hypothetical protein MMC33_007241 [Icmadophila ericetorum]|nr:hypothetical protein [Icmadophila ericetorum]
MVFNQVIRALPFLSLAYGLPTGQSTSAAIKARNTLEARNGYGSVVTSSTGLSWYDSNFNDGNSGYEDTEYYYCFYGDANNFPPMANWMNFYAMFDLNQDDSLD